MSDKDLYKSPLRKLAQFFEKSRDNWKAKSLANKKKHRQLKKKFRTLEISKKRWKDEALDLRKQLKTIKQTTETIENELVASKKNRN
jgi:septal ring factor EnvC (AmiA/AmiB activator)